MRADQLIGCLERLPLLPARVEGLDVGHLARLLDVDVLAHVGTVDAARREDAITQVLTVAIGADKVAVQVDEPARVGVKRLEACLTHVEWIPRRAWLKRADAELADPRRVVYAVVVGVQIGLGEQAGLKK